MSIDAALFSGSKYYFFEGNQYIRVTRSETGPDKAWRWPGGFGVSVVAASRARNSAQCLVRARRGQRRYLFVAERLAFLRFAARFAALGFENSSVLMVRRGYLKDFDASRRAWL
jgi:hypothetical protein